MHGIFRCEGWLGLLAAACLTIGQTEAAEPTGAVWQVTLTAQGRLSIRHGEQEVATLAPGGFSPAWVPARSHLVAQGRDTVGCEVDVPGCGLLDCLVKLTPAAGGGVRIEGAFTAKSALQLNGLFLVCDLPVACMTNRLASFDEHAVTVPDVFDGQSLRLWSGRAAHAQLALARLPPFDLAAEKPVGILLQDNRKWNATLSLRLATDLPQGGRLAKGATAAVAFTLLPSQTMRVTLPQPLTVAAGADWIPLPVELDIQAGSALDWSQQIPRHAPAGSLGWMTASRDGHFVFEQAPAAPVRFYGVNFCFGAQYLAHDEADRLAERLLRLGYNSVRIHHYERELMDTNTAAGLAFRPEQIDKLDYLLAALRRRGIYWTTDLFVSRPVPQTEIGIATNGLVDATDFRLRLHVDEAAVASWRAFARLLLTHRNPYTNLRCVDDPALHLICLVNEGNIANYLTRLSPELQPLYQHAWNRFLAGRYQTPAALAAAWGMDPGGDPAAGTVPLVTDLFGAGPRAEDCGRFCAELESRLYRRLSGILRDELHCRALLTNLNGWNDPRGYQSVRKDFDYVDQHLYVGHPQWVGKPWGLPTRTDDLVPTQPFNAGGLKEAFCRIPGKPFTVTEFNYAAPSRYRGAGGLITGTLAALQDWDGLWRFAYSHRSEGEFAPAPMSYFDLCRDPLNQAADRAMLTLFLRRDAAVAPHGLVIALGADTHVPASGRVEPGWRALALTTRAGSTADAITNAAWTVMPALGAPGGPVGAYDSGAATAAEARVAATASAAWQVDARHGVYASDTGEFRLDRAGGVLTVNTPRTAGGFRMAAGVCTAGVVNVQILDGPATVWVTSLDGRPIGESRRLLVTHLTDAQQEGTRFADDGQQMLLAWGAGRPLVRAGRASVALPVPAGNVRAWGLATSGARGSACTVSRADCHVALPLDVAGPEGARMLYEIEVADGDAAKRKVP